MKTPVKGKQKRNVIKKYDYHIKWLRQLRDQRVNDENELFVKQILLYHDKIHNILFMAMPQIKKKDAISFWIEDEKCRILKSVFLRAAEWIADAGMYDFMKKHFLKTGKRFVILEGNKFSVTKQIINIK